VGGQILDAGVKIPFSIKTWRLKSIKWPICPQGTSKIYITQRASAGRGNEEQRW
jgi:hypothetical protein